jgi:hypothetical protein
LIQSIKERTRRKPNLEEQEQIESDIEADVIMHYAMISPGVSHSFVSGCLSWRLRDEPSSNKISFVS